MIPQKAIATVDQDKESHNIKIPIKLPKEDEGPIAAHRKHESSREERCNACEIMGTTCVLCTLSMEANDLIAVRDAKIDQALNK
eukprot:CAMPEP_0185599728 /NCGR_PEP_ID=MMETSP0434-20130131/82900_1 /TAXON_ID=626734 ORGANISM="Favella taraikaensis, Strain Fe Narragansett Bay" /NCGR_SAMPLE_ID=MMETSP0434 /ASSEMBLY_ACC=CAM_ASM_000379 /LENGTH=83 /DNA_ID=CAMNT_0028229229 /DNA_START=1407 /DNA_END=1658 /DNA_ORIENTATION=+